MSDGVEGQLTDADVDKALHILYEEGYVVPAFASIRDYFPEGEQINLLIPEHNEQMKKLRAADQEYAEAARAAMRKAILAALTN